MATVSVIGRKKSRTRPESRMQFDYWLLLALAGLIVSGLLMVYSATFDLGLLAKDDSLYYFRRQFVALLIGLGITLFLLQFDYHIFQKFSVLIMGGTLAILAVLLFVGQANFGAIRGLYDNSYQPSELAKLATILYISHWLASKGEKIKDVTYGLFPFAIITGTVCYLIVQQPDLSTAGLVALISFTLFFIAGADWKQIIIAGVAGTGIFVALMFTVPHAQARVSAWRDVLRDPDLAIWQVKQALIALGSGGFTGVGLGNSTQKFGPLPAAHTDGIFAILGEELGLIGCLIIIGLVGLLFWRGIRAAKQARDAYGFLLALGITFWLAYQALMNIAVITAVIPFTGIPLPFLSYGGTSLLFSVIGAGILLNISRDAYLITRAKQPARPDMEQVRARANKPAEAGSEQSSESGNLRRRNRWAYLSRFSRRS